jgi:hypothetical protein
MRSWFTAALVAFVGPAVATVVVAGTGGDCLPCTAGAITPTDSTFTFDFGVIDYTITNGSLPAPYCHLQAKAYTSFECFPSSSGFNTCKLCWKTGLWSCPCTDPCSTCCSFPPGTGGWCWDNCNTLFGDAYGYFAGNLIDSCMGMYNRQLTYDQDWLTKSRYYELTIYCRAWSGSTDDCAGDATDYNASQTSKDISTW